MSSVLVTGGAGYIGSVVVEKLLEDGNDVVVIDNLKTGHRETEQCKCYWGDCGDPTPGLALRQAFENHKFDLVIHLAGETTVTMAETRPDIYYRNNVVNTIKLLDVMKEYGCNRIHFASSAAVYMPSVVSLSVNSKLRPLNAYGWSKVMIERIIRDYQKAFGLKYTIFRYFNVAGASQKYGEDHYHETHLIPLLLQVASGERDYIPVYGNGIRDYIHVLDIAREHAKLETENKTYNLGRGAAYTVLEIIDLVKEITGKPINYLQYPPRIGDPACIYSREFIRITITIKTIIKSAWQWHQKHPRGYNGRPD